MRTEQVLREVAKALYGEARSANTASEMGQLLVRLTRALNTAASHIEAKEGR